MADATIPVDLFNPGQVFACLGFMEAADILLGDAEGGFDWSETGQDRFRLQAAGSENPVEAVLAFLAASTLREAVPEGWTSPDTKARRGPAPDSETETKTERSADVPDRIAVTTFTTGTADAMSLPIVFGGGNRPSVMLDHWTDGSSRNPFKLYSGNRSAFGIASAMLAGKHAKNGKLESKGLRQLFEDDREALVRAPFHVLTPMGGSFNFDPRGAWTGLDAGYSPNDQDHDVLASPVVEFLAAWGLEHARPDEYQTRKVRYAVWRPLLPPALARAVIGGAQGIAQTRGFGFGLAMSGKNKVVCFAQEEPST